MVERLKITIFLLFVSHGPLPVEDETKDDALYNVLYWIINDETIKDPGHEKILIFVNDKETVTHLEDILSKEGFSVIGVKRDRDNGPGRDLDDLGCIMVFSIFFNCSKLRLHFRTCKCEHACVYWNMMHLALRRMEYDMKKFANSAEEHPRILVTTDVLGRGVDFTTCRPELWLKNIGRIELRKTGIVWVFGFKP